MTKLWNAIKYDGAAPSPEVMALGLPIMHQIYDWDIDRHKNGVLSESDMIRYKAALRNLPNGASVLLDQEQPADAPEAYFQLIYWTAKYHRPDCTFGIWDKSIGDIACVVGYVSSGSQAEEDRVVNDVIDLWNDEYREARVCTFLSPVIQGTNTIVPIERWRSTVQRVAATGSEIAVWNDGETSWYVPRYLAAAKEITG